MPTPPILGHVVIRELNSSDYAANKADFLTIKIALATEASKPENILKIPNR
jgi:hypothetical protein